MAEVEKSLSSLSQSMPLYRASRLLTDALASGKEEVKGTTGITEADEIPEQPAND
ncbi:MAG TPA: hypothetical protein VK638_04270 [Edaphobacter sp.]|nr:hypothetical protein [Edaphobacter sp.]